MHGRRIRDGIGSGWGGYEEKRSFFMREEEDGRKRDNSIMLRECMDDAFMR